MAFNKYAGVLSILLAMIAIVGVFLPLGVSIIDLIGVFGWKINFSSSPLGLVNLEPTGILASLLGPIFETFYPSLSSNIILPIIGFAILTMSFFIIIFGILQIVKSKSIAYPIVNICIAIIVLILPVVSYLRFVFNITPQYRQTFIILKSLISMIYPTASYLPVSIDEFPTIGFYLIVLTQIVIIIISTTAVIITAIQKKKEKL